MEFDINYNYIEIYITEPDTTVTLSSNRRGDTTELDTTDWGDNTSDLELSHVYKNIGTYIIKSKLTINEVACDEKINELVTNYYMINSNMTNLDYLMAGFINIKDVNFNNFGNYSNITDMKGMFKLCKSLETISMRKYIIKKVKDLSYFLYGCSNLKNIDLFSFKDNKPTNIDYMFSNTPLNFIDDINLYFLDTTYVRSASHLFENCLNLTNFKKVIENLNFIYCDNIEYCFSNTGITEAENLELLNCEDIVSLEGLFYNCKYLTRVDLRNFITFDIENMQNTFADCPVLEYVDLRNLRLSEIINLKYTFKNDISLKRININGLNIDTLDILDYTGIIENTSLNRIDMFGCNEDTVNFFIVNILPSTGGIIKVNRTDNINLTIAESKSWSFESLNHEEDIRCLLLSNLEISLNLIKNCIMDEYSQSSHTHEEYQERISSIQKRVKNATDRLNKIIE